MYAFLTCRSWKMRVVIAHFMTTRKYHAVIEKTDSVWYIILRKISTQVSCMFLLLYYISILVQPCHVFLDLVYAFFYFYLNEVNWCMKSIVSVVASARNSIKVPVLLVFRNDGIQQKLYQLTPFK